MSGDIAASGADVARRYFAAVGAGDRGELTDVLADGIRYHFPGRSSFARDYDGKVAVLEYLDRLATLTGGSLQVEVKDVLANDDRAVGLVQATAERDGVVFSWELAAVLSVHDGRVSELWLYYRDQYGIDEFLG